MARMITAISVNDPRHGGTRAGRATSWAQANPGASIMAEAIAFESRVTAEWPRESAPAQGLWLHWPGGSRHLGEPVCVGADPANEVVLDDRHVSAFHCRLHQHAGRWLVTDLGSTNGTFLDGARVAEAELDAGARIRLGSHELRVDRPPARMPSMPGLLARDPALGPALEL